MEEIRQARRAASTFTAAGSCETTIVQRSSLEPGTELLGPVIVEEELSTTVVPPGAHVIVHKPAA